MAGLVAFFHLTGAQAEDRKGKLEDARRQTEGQAEIITDERQWAKAYRKHEYAEAAASTAAALLIGALSSEESQHGKSKPLDQRLLFLDYPYEGAQRGNRVGIDRIARSGAHLDVSTRSLRLSAQYGYDLSGIHWPQLAVSFVSRKNLGFESRLSYLNESLQGGGTDHLGLADAYFVWAPGSRAWEISLGVGARAMFAPHRLSVRSAWAAGISGLFGVTLFPVNPLVLKVKGHTGNLGYAYFVQAQGSLGITYRGAEIFCGYDFMQIGEVPFHGPAVGIRGWL